MRRDEPIGQMQSRAVCVLDEFPACAGMNRSKLH